MIKQKNFSNVDPSSLPADTVYEQCNFVQTVPDTSGADPKGVRLWPGDDTPRTFINCNLVNCEPPPGSICTSCNHSINKYNVFSHVDEVWVDNVLVHSEDKHNMEMYGRYNPDTESYEYNPSVIVVPEDY